MLNKLKVSFDWILCIFIILTILSSLYGIYLVFSVSVLIGIICLLVPTFQVTFLIVSIYKMFTGINLAIKILELSKKLFS